MTLAPGTRLGPYEITEPLGAGGMGEVYRARDTRLERQVAVKIISPEFARDPERLRRFKQEAQAAGMLSHPNILAIHDVGSHEGVSYLVTELLEGESFAQRLTGSPLPVRKVLAYAIPIARALAAAHEKGIVHRDLKPGNLFLTRDGQVKILDFGLAKLRPPVGTGEARSEGVTRSFDTEPGSRLGTVGYMSPEQVDGRPADNRSDIFSFGAVLYEMLTGRRAFRGETAVETLNAILREDPPSVSEFDAGLSPALDRIVRHCLEKRPEERFQSARDLAFDLEAFSEVSISRTAPSAPRPLRGRLGRASTILAVVALLGLGVTVVWRMFFAFSQGPGFEARKRIVVLPLENLGPSEDQYFADGMTEEITSRLASVRALAVISRTSALQYDRKGKTMRQIGQDLGADYVLEGSVRWEGTARGHGRVRITPQLIQVKDDTHLWSAAYERELERIFELQSEIAERVVQSLGGTLVGAERQALEEKLTENMEAYQAYLRGREIRNQLGASRERRELGVRLLERAVQLDPSFAVAYAELSEAHSLLHSGLDRSEERLTKARAALQRARELAPDHVAVKLAEGQLHTSLYEWQPALEALRAAAQARPFDSRILSDVGAVMLLRGDLADALAAFEQALPLEPRDARLLYRIGGAYRGQRDHASADRYYDRGVAIAPDSPLLWVVKVENLVSWKGTTAEARTLLERSPVREDPALFPIWVRLDLTDRRYAEALKRIVAGPVSVLPPREQIEVAFYAALAHERLGQREQARSAAESLRGLAEDRLRSFPGNSAPHTARGLALAMLGRSEEALREGRMGVQIQSSEAWTGPLLLQWLAVIHTLLGQADPAIDHLARLLSLQYSDAITVAELRLDPVWDPLREHPRFQKLLEKHEPRPGSERASPS